MAGISIYLNFSRNTMEVFEFYKSVFGGEYFGDVMRYRDIPPQEGAPTIPDEDKDLIMHIALPIMGGTMLMGTDAPESMGFNVIAGNNVHINLEIDTRKETDQLFKSLSGGGKVLMPLQDMFWGAYYGNCVDKFGIQWMFSCNETLL